MYHLLVIARYSILKSYKYRLIISYFIVVLIKLLRDLSSKSLDEYMSTQHIFMI